MSKKVGFYTLGCKLNFSETATIAREFDEGGFTRAVAGEIADIYVINTCSVTDSADKKCRNIIRKFVKMNPDAIIAVTGCYAQLKPDEIAAIEGVDIVIGNNDKGNVAEMVKNLAMTKGKSAVIHTCEAEELKNFFASFSTAERTRAFLKVQDGCNYHCAYCTIPLARGESRNISIERLVAEAAQIAASGRREIVLTGINIGDFGRTNGETFLDLITALDGVEGVDRYRISSIEPNLLTDEIIEFTTRSRKFQPHFHIPLQSGTDKILGLMRRRYTTATFGERIEAVRRAMPDAFIGIDVIVGFPGETEQDFQQTYDFLAYLKPAFLHIFPYSERDNTPAIDFVGKVSPSDKAARAERLAKLSDKLHFEFIKTFEGQQRPVLFETMQKGGTMSGFTDNYIRTTAPYRKESIGKIEECLVVL